MNNLPEKVTMCEVGLRDGLQNEKVIPTTDDKLAILRGFIDAGYKVIEVGSFMHPKKVPQMADTDEIFKRIGDVPEDVVNPQHSRSSEGYRLRLQEG